MRSRWSLVLLAVGMVAAAGCATSPETAPGVVWVAEFSSSKFGPVSNAFADPRECSAWRDRYRGTECLRARLGEGADRWLFPVEVGGGAPAKLYVGSFERETCEAITATFPRGGMRAAGGCQPYRLTP